MKRWLGVTMALALACAALPAVAVCDSCGVVTSVKTVKKAPEAGPIEKSRNATTAYVVEVRLENDAIRTFNYGAATAYKVGDKVKIVAKKLVRR
jgi:hypothetical protein